MNRLAFTVVLVIVLGWAASAEAQYVQVCGYQPTTVYYAPAPTTVYYAPVPRVTYYAPATYYYAPTPVYTTRYRPFLGGSITRVRYNYPAYYYGW